MKNYTYEEIKNLIKVGMRLRAFNSLSGELYFNSYVQSIQASVKIEGYADGFILGQNGNTLYQIIEGNKPADDEEKTWDNIDQNTIFEKENGDEKFVLGVCGKAIFTSGVDNIKTAGSIYTKEELIQEGWKIKGASEDRPSIEVAISELEFLTSGTLDERDMIALRKVIEMLKSLK